MRTANYELVMDAAAETEIEHTFDAYAQMHDILESVGVLRRTDTFELQRAAYDTIRRATQLPSRLVTNGIREYASGSWSKDRLPLDEKLMSFKGVDHVSISTVSGRVVVGCLMTGYGQDDAKAALSHLVRSEDRYSLAVPLSRDMQNKEIEAMQTESIPSRVSRLAAGLANLVVDSLEAKAPEAVAEQAIREIDKGVQDIRMSLASTTAERKRYDLQRERLQLEAASIEKDARIAIENGRDDLAKTGIGRLEDIEAQVGSLDRLIEEVDGRIEEAELAIRAAEAARRDAAERVRIARKAKEETAPSSPAFKGRQKPMAIDRIAAALGVVERMTDLPAGTSRDPGLQELEDFGRERRIEDRLAAMREQIGRKG